MALSVELTLEEAMGLSQYTLRGNDTLDNCASHNNSHGDSRCLLQDTNGPSFRLENQRKPGKPAKRHNKSLSIESNVDITVTELF
jgi:hypothetical protein